MSDLTNASMFDYDARPITPQVAIVGLRASSVGYQRRRSPHEPPQWREGVTAAVATFPARLATRTRPAVVLTAEQPVSIRRMPRLSTHF